MLFAALIDDTPETEYRKTLAALCIDMGPSFCLAGQRNLKVTGGYGNDSFGANAQSLPKARTWYA